MINQKREELEKVKSDDAKQLAKENLTSMKYILEQNNTRLLVLAQNIDTTKAAIQETEQNLEKVVQKKRHMALAVSNEW